MIGGIPINLVEGIELSIRGNGIATATVTRAEAAENLSWDRFVRLNAAARALSGLSLKTILDAGGYDGALAFFLKDATIDVIDAATTGGSVLDIPSEDAAYDAVVAVDLLEHIEPKDRSKALSEFARTARRYVVLNYPCRDSHEAQELALKLTKNSLVREHVEWELPDSDWVLEELSKYGYSGIVTPHTSIAIWLGQYTTLNLLPDQAKDLNHHLVANYAEEPTTRSLYHLVVCQREHST